MKILLAEDNEFVRKMVSHFLQELGHIVIECEDGLEALIAIVKNSDVNFVLSDINMPFLDGIDLTKAVHALKPALPIVLISVGYSDEQKNSALSSGAVFVTDKPKNIEELRRLIREYGDIASTQ